MPVTRLIDYMPQIEQGLHDLVAWVEKGVEPAGTNADYRDGKVVIPTTAAERAAGSNRSSRATANGAPRADVKVRPKSPRSPSPWTPRCAGREPAC